MSNKVKKLLIILFSLNLLLLIIVFFIVTSKNTSKESNNCWYNIFSFSSKNNKNENLVKYYLLSDVDKENTDNFINILNQQNTNTVFLLQAINTLPNENLERGIYTINSVKNLHNYSHIHFDKNKIEYLNSNKVVKILDDDKFIDSSFENLLLEIDKNISKNLNIVPFFYTPKVNNREKKMFIDKVNKKLSNDEVFVFYYNQIDEVKDYDEFRRIYIKRLLTNLNHYNNQEYQKMLNRVSPGIKDGLDIFLRDFNQSKKNNFVTDAEDLNSLNGYFIKNKKVDNSSDIIDDKVMMLWGGDLMLDRYINYFSQLHGDDFSIIYLKEYLANNDFLIVNHEGPVTNFAPQELDGDNTTFTFNEKYLPVLKNYNFNIFSLANNHTRDYGKKGYEQTKDYFKKYKFDYFGDYYNEDNVFIIKEINNKKIAFVGYNEFSYYLDENIVNTISTLRPKVNFIIVFSHWGVEYTNNVSKKQKDLAYQFIDNGADLVIGAHPHVIQPIEEYKGKIIFYSLGNFVFDQIRDGTKDGLKIGMVLDDNYLKLYIFPIIIDNFQTRFVENDEDISKELLNLVNMSNISENLQNQVKNGIITQNIE